METRTLGRSDLRVSLIGLGCNQFGGRLDLEGTRQLIPYFPLGGGALTGKYRKGAPMPENSRLTNTKASADRFLSPNADRIEKLAAFAEARGHTILELALSWLARHPQVASIITGATRPAQIDANVKAVSWALSPEEMAEVDRITGN